MAHSTLQRGGRVLLAAALAGAGLAAAIVTQSGGAATEDTTTTTTTAATTTTAGTAPANTSAPTLSGTPSAGSTLSASPGSWSGTATIAYAYQWQRCSSTGGSCAAISGATAQTYALGSADVGNTVRVVVTATNSTGSSSSTSAPSAVIAAAATTTTTAPAPPANGCPSAAKGQVVPVAQVAAPARLQITGFQSNPGRLTASTTSFTLKVIVGDGCGHPVQGALVYATAVPFSQFDVPAEQATGADGSTTLTFSRGPAYPASRRQELLALFLRARKSGDSKLGGISTRQLVSVPVSLR
jgi:predicted actin-binding protein